MLLNFLGAYRWLVPANPTLTVSVYGQTLIKKYEGLGPRGVEIVNGVKTVFPYICPAGKCTIGYGIVISWNEYYRLKHCGIPLTQAEEDFKKTVHKFAKNVSPLIKVPVKSYQFDSVVSLAYNVGIANLKSSTLLRKLNLKDFVGASKEFGKWVYANKKKLPGLVNRREAERRMFVNDPPRPEPGAKVVNILQRKQYLKRLMYE